MNDQQVKYLEIKENIRPFSSPLQSPKRTVGRDVGAADPIIGFSECFITVHIQPSPTREPVVTPTIGANGLLCIL